MRRRSVESPRSGEPGEQTPQAPRSRQVWNVPRPRTPAFTGREQLLADLASGLGAQPVVALVGPAGIGKTALAVEHAHRHSADYDVVWWVRAGRPETLAGDYARLAPALGVGEETGPDQALHIGAARRRLDGGGRWLLVLDDAADVDDWRPYVPDGGHVVVTTEAPPPTSAAMSLAVGELRREDAVTFLLERTGQDDAASAQALAGALQDHPLALGLAAAWISAQGTLSDYLSRLRDPRNPLSGARPGGTGGPAEHPPTVAATGRLSLEALRRASRTAADLLALCSYLAPDDIPCQVLLAHPDVLPRGLRGDMTSDRLDELVEVLGRFGLAERLGDAMSVHRLVQAVVRDQLASKDQRLWAGAAVRVTASSYPTPDDPTNWAACERLVPHALAVAEHAERLGTEMPAAGWLLNGSALYLRTRARFEAARAGFERALAIDEAASGPDHLAVGADLNNLGLVLRDLGDLPGAKKRLARALAIDKAAYGTDHPVVATRLMNLALVLRDLGDLDRARQGFERALVIEEAVNGAGHPRTAGVLNGLGLVLQDLGELQAAEECLRRALAGVEAASGPHHPKTATALNDLGLVLQDLDELAGARDCFERALAIDEAAYGPDHPEVGADLNNLGLVLQDMGDLTGAEKCLGRALAIDEAAYGPDDPAVGTDLNNLGLVLQDMGDLTGAETCLGRALSIAEAARGPDHPSTGSIRDNLASVRRALAAASRGPADPPG